MPKCTNTDISRLLLLRLRRFALSARCGLSGGVQGARHTPLRRRKTKHPENCIGHRKNYVLCSKNYIRHNSNYIRPFSATYKHLKDKSLQRIFYSCLLLWKPTLYVIQDVFAVCCAAKHPLPFQPERTVLISRKFIVTLHCIYIITHQNKKYNSFDEFR